MQRIGGLLALLAMSFLPAAWPQASSSTVRGTVRDQGQAVVPKANVTLTNTATNVARTIVETGSPAGPLTTGGPPTPQTLVSIFCVPPTFNTVVDSAADLPGPGAVALEGTTQLQ